MSIKRFANLSSTRLAATRRITALSSQLTTTTGDNRAFKVFQRTMASVPSTMKGVIIEQTGGSDVLQWRDNLTVPKPGDGEILVKNDFVGVNYIDTYFRTGLYPVPKWPYILGREAEGTVVAVGSGETYGFKEGDKVTYLNEYTYAEYTAANASKAFKLPSGIKPQVGAAAILQGLTALTLIRDAHHVNKGDWVLVHAAAGGTGLWLCQLLRAVGANTIGTASTEEKVALAKKAGATHMINYSKEDVKSKVDELTGGKGVIAVFDGVGKDTFETSFSVLARKGSMISFGNASGAPEPFTIARLGAKNLRLMRPGMFGYIVTRDEFLQATEDLFDIIGKGEIDLKIHEVYALSDVKKAHDDLQGRKTTGKLLLDPSK